MVSQDPRLKIVPAFAVPIVESRLEHCEPLNRELEALFLARETDEYRNPTPSHIPQREVFESRFNLFRWPEGCVQELRRFVLDTVARSVLALTTLTPADLRSLAFQNHTWFHVTRYAGSFVAHNHPMASWSAVYCVRAGEEVPGRPESGMLRFLDPRAGANAYLDPANESLRPPYRVRAAEFRLTEGQIVVFPSYLFHEVTPFYGQDLRVTVATNCWFSRPQ
ncbi:MAG TPA: putative 2OG-Fe(II) oxygenase [Steroidobacteraceae bacterium]|nr:putative 2OG-Fe(II) oxygenase [Steroidobacteraceae bacterium]